MGKRVLLTATVQSHIAQFHKPLINLLNENGYEVHIAARDNLKEKNGLKIENADKIYNLPFSRSPKSPDNIKAYRQLKKIIDNNDYDIVHCNTPMGGIVTRLAARKARKKGTKVFYTAHGFHFYKGAPIKNWLIYYPVEKFFARYTDKLITINHEDFQTAKKICNEAYYIHGVGVDENRYNLLPPNIDIRLEIGLCESDFIVLCSGELNNNKNQITLIRALYRLKNYNIKVLLAGNGPQKNILEKEIKKLNLENNVMLLGYRNDLQNFVKTSDIICSVSIREGLGLNVIEGMMCGKPVVVSNNRGHRELIQNGINGYIIGTHNSVELADKIEKLYSDRFIAEKFGKYNAKIGEKFSSSNVKKELKYIYRLNNVIVS